MENNKGGGYVGLLVLLLTATIIAFVFWRSDLLMPKGENGEPVKNAMEQNQEAIDQASAVKNILEQKSREAAQVN